MHLNAREYDPTLGRFISRDPVIDFTDPQQMNGYAYGHNSPVTFSDPSGLYDDETSDGSGLRSYSRATTDSSGKTTRTRIFSGGGGSGGNTPNVGGPPPPPPPPTIGDVVRGTLGAYAKDAGFGSLDEWMESVCRGNKRCLAAYNKLMAGMDAYLFDCSSFPGAGQCSSDFPEWIKTAYRHIEFGVDFCDGGCVALEFQGGVLQLTGGIGLVGAGGAITWNSLDLHDQGSLSISIGGAYYAGAEVGLKPEVDSHGNWSGLGWEAGVTFGMGEIEPFIGYNIVSYDFARGTWQNPLPPGVDRWFTAHCKEIWWC